ncbi:MAG TPA: GNAT family N-acetyltransferase [Firmicutes bacterium]|nr:GNAT family N-acetyltransferase [Bacillota bacterium]
MGKNVNENEKAVATGKFTYLRPIMEEDLEKLLEWDNDPEINRWTGKKFESLEQGHRWLGSSRAGRSNRLAFAIVKHDGRLVGDLEFEQVNWRSKMAELRISIGDKTQWGKGLGTDAVHCALRFAKERLRLKRMYLRVAADNSRAIKCYIKCGFRKRGVLRVSHTREGMQDLILMEATLP